MRSWALAAKGRGGSALRASTKASELPVYNPGEASRPQGFNKCVRAGADVIVTGEMLLGSQAVRGAGAGAYAINPSSGERLEPAFAEAGQAEVAIACRLAEAAADSFRETSLADRATFLETIAEQLLALGEALVDRAMAESGLPRGRIEGERGRTVGQLRLFAGVVRDGHWIGATLDAPLPDRKPLPRVDLRMRNIGLGPVAVFGASNFPLAFSVAGGDTASALAAGCPVIAKSHPSHLGTSELAGRAIQSAVAKCGLPEGVFSLLVGQGHALGEALVQHPAIQAVGFTGSRRGGLALAKLAAARAQPIPVFAEMSSVNPLFLLPGALEARAEAIGLGLVESVTLGVGQFCTNPGLVFGVDGPAFERCAQAAAEAVAGKAAATMLNAGIADAYAQGRARLAAQVDLLAGGRLPEGPAGAAVGQPALFRTTGENFLATPALAEELFGPATLLVACSGLDQMLRIATNLEGQLTCGIFLDADQAESQDISHARLLVPILERKAGRLLVNGYPTGVEVGHAMVHGGPFPATTESRSTSVGARAIERFLRPVCYQDFPETLLPPALQTANPLGIARWLDGVPTR